MDKVRVDNAGMLLLQCFFSRIFFLAGLFCEGNKSFKNEESKIRAIFMLQYLVYGEEKEYDEKELYLNRIVVGMEDEMQLPKSCKLNKEEMAIVGSLIPAIKPMWSFIKNTTDDGVRKSFLQRMGSVSCEMSGKETIWVVEVDEKPYDVLLDSLPWGYVLCRYPWMDDVLIRVKWRK